MNITCESELIKGLSKDLGELYLENDIYITDKFEVIEEFNGVLDGNGYTVYDLESVFIEEFNGVMKNISFSSGCFGGLVSMNFGELLSIHVTDLKGEIVTDSYFGVIAKENYSDIKDCSVSDVCVYTTSSSGGICGLNDTGDVIDCKLNDVQLNCRKSDSGGIVGLYESGCLKNCTVKNCFVLGTNATGGIVGRISNEGSVRNCHVINSKIECEFMDGGGIVARVDESAHVYNCSIENSEILGYMLVSLIADCSESVSMEDCHVEGCTAEVFKKQRKSKVFLLSENVENCFITDTDIRGEVDLSPIYEIVNSYVDVIVRSESEPEFSIDSKSVYIDICHETVSKTGKDVLVSTVDDLKNVSQFDTVELCSDLDFEGSNFEKISRFSGVFNGNGYTLSNLSEPLFNRFTGSLKNLSINEFCIRKYARAGCIAKYSVEGQLKNINVVKSKCSTIEKRVIGLLFDLRNGRIQNCSVKMQFNSNVIYGFCASIEDSLIRNCKSELDIGIGSKGSGFTSNCKFESSIVNSTVTGNVCLNENRTRFSGLCQSGDLIRNCNSDITIRKKKSVSTIDQITGVAKKASVLKNCEFTGSITLGELDSINLYTSRVSGIVLEGNNCEMHNCVNKGEIVAINKGGPVSGIMAKKFRDTKIVNCRNEARIIGGKLAGGIVGESDSNGKIVGSKNLGEIQAEICGGIVGRLLQGSVRKCYNQANIDSDDVLIGDVVDDYSDEISNLFYISTNSGQQSEYGKETKQNPEMLNNILNL